MAYGTRARNLLPLIVLVAVLLRGPAAAAGTPVGLRLVDRLLDHLGQCRDYQFRVTAYERQGDQEEERTFRLFVKEERLVRIQVLAGRGKGSEAVLDAQGRVRGRKRGLLKTFATTLKPDDRRIRSLRGQPFWELACHHFLKELRARVAQPGTACEVEWEGEPPGLARLVLQRAPATRETYWVDLGQIHVLRGEDLESGRLVQRFAVSEVKENAGLSDAFFCF
jgi:outer membrane lipoprotein-sorting protein